MSTGLQAIALCSPIIASNAVFSARRASRGVDSIDENPFYAAANMDIAAAQTVKGGRAAKAIALATNSNAEFFQSAGDAIKNLSDKNKLVKGACKVINFTADNINPIICVTSGIKVLGSEDKTDAAAREGLALSAMFASEHAAKKIIGMPAAQQNTFKGNNNALYKQNPFLKQQAEALKDYCDTKKLFNSISLKAVPGALKGLAFVTASIAGYKLGTAIGNEILGEQRA